MAKGSIDRHARLRPSPILRSLVKVGRNNKLRCLFAVGIKVSGGAATAEGTSCEFVLGNIVRITSSRHSDASLPLKFSGRKTGFLIALNMLSERLKRGPRDPIGQTRVTNVSISAM